MVVVAADSPTPTAPGPVHTGGVDGTAMDHRTGHPGWRKRCSGDNGPGIPLSPPLAPWHTQPLTGSEPLEASGLNCPWPSSPPLTLISDATSLLGYLAAYTPTCRSLGWICFPMGQ